MTGVVFIKTDVAGDATRTRIEYLRHATFKSFTEKGSLEHMVAMSRYGHADIQFFRPEQFEAIQAEAKQFNLSPDGQAWVAKLDDKIHIFTPF